VGKRGRHNAIVLRGGLVAAVRRESPALALTRLRDELAGSLGDCACKNLVAAGSCSGGGRPFFRMRGTIPTDTARRIEAILLRVKIRSQRTDSPKGAHPLHDRLFAARLTAEETTCATRARKK
jgi:hypothetical protein